MESQLENRYSKFFPVNTFDHTWSPWNVNSLRYKVFLILIGLFDLTFDVLYLNLVLNNNNNNESLLSQRNTKKAH